jgi:hypothetical protein
LLQIVRAGPRIGLAVLPQDYFFPSVAVSSVKTQISEPFA